MPPSGRGRVRGQRPDEDLRAGRLGTLPRSGSDRAAGGTAVRRRSRRHAARCPRALLRHLAGAENQAPGRCCDHGRRAAAVRRMTRRSPPTSTPVTSRTARRGGISRSTPRASATRRVPSSSQRSTTAWMDGGFFALIAGDVAKVCARECDARGDHRARSHEQGHIRLRNFPCGVTVVICFTETGSRRGGR